MNEALVSVIIPMYNAEATINRAIQSVQAQTYKNLDIIVIDDGSTDHGSKEVQQLKKSDDRIQFFQQNNQGPSMARNKGLIHATGAFIQFVDADDWIQPTMTAQLVDMMTAQSDLVICGYETEDKTIRPRATCLAPRVKWLEKISALYEQTLLPSPCNKLYRRAFIEEYNILFSSQFSIGEDLLFNLDYLRHCGNIAFTEATPYKYCYEASSLTRQYEPTLFPTQKNLHEYFVRFLYEQDSATTRNLTTANRIFLHSTTYAISNVYQPKTPLTYQQQYKVLQSIVLDETVQEVARTKDSFFTFFIRKRGIFCLHIFYTLKSFVKKIIRRQRG